MFKDAENINNQPQSENVFMSRENVFTGLDKWQKRVNHKRGALSLEMMGIIAIIAILVMSGLYYLNIMMRDTKVNDAIAAMQLINTKVAEMYMNEASYNGLKDDIFIGSGNAPASIINSDRKTLKSPWGKMTLGPEESDKAFSLTFDSVPKDVCQKLGSIVRNSTAWQKLTVGSSEWDITEKANDNLVNFLSTACQDGPNNTLKFTSRQQ